MDAPRARLEASRFWQRHLQRWVLAAIALGWFGLLLQRLQIRMPHHVGFLLVLGLIGLSNLWMWAWVDERFRPGTAARSRRTLRAAWWIYAAAMIAPIPAGRLLRQRFAWDSLPVPLIMWLMTWHLLLVGITAVALAAVIVRLGWCLIRRAPDHAAASPPQPDPSSEPGRHRPGPGSGTSRLAAPRGADCPSRRTLLTRAVAAAPLAITAGAVVSESITEGRFRVRRVSIRLPRLPDRLRGLTITHLSDIHVGRLLRPEHLPRVVDAANRLGSDLVAVTGDIIDHSNEFLPHACDAIAALEHRYGRFLVVGNHDLIDAPREFLAYVKRRDIGLIIDRHERLRIGGEDLQVAGLFWSADDQTHLARAREALAFADPALFTIALAHHPHAFDVLADLGADLTLSGHTHGGQLMLTPPEAPVRLGAGSLLFRYIWGEYRRGPASLFVNAGVGNWFPLRLNAPAEVVQLRLV